MQAFAPDSSGFRLTATKYSIHYTAFDSASKKIFVSHAPNPEGLKEGYAHMSTGGVFTEENNKSKTITMKPRRKKEL